MVIKKIKTKFDKWKKSTSDEIDKKKKKTLQFYKLF
jgi:hypothetical protein